MGMEKFNIFHCNGRKTGIAAFDWLWVVSALRAILQWWAQDINKV